MRSIAINIAALQLTVAVFAVYSSNQDILSDGACIGGVFGTLANLLILSVSVVVALILGVRSRRDEKARRALGSWLILASSSSVAILIGQYAALRCTV
jgi:predicted Co/Zn/Cd cation transporter (cation efflux family)